MQLEYTGEQVKLEVFNNQQSITNKYYCSRFPTFASERRWETDSLPKTIQSSCLGLSVLFIDQKYQFIHCQ